MSMKRTVNGRRIERTGEFKSNYYRQTTDIQQQSLLVAASNAERTKANRSQETMEKQRQARLDKEAAQARAKELEQSMQEIMTKLDKKNLSLKDKMLASFKTKGVEETLKSFESELVKFSKLNEEYAGLNILLSVPKMKNFYNDFLYDLAVNDSNFILYLPTDCFLHYHDELLRFDELSQEDLSKLEARLEKENVFKNQVFCAKYLRFFPNRVGDMTKISDISYALSIAPECIKKLPLGCSLRVGFFQNPDLLLTIIKRSPKVLMYITQKELYLVADSSTATIGRSIAKCPEILSSPNFDNAFFKRFHPKYIFSSINKTEFKPIIAPYFDKLPILEEFFNSVKIRRSTVSSGV